MGGACQFCGATQPLEFDCHPVPETSHHFMPWPQRIRFYWQQFLKGNLRLLCKRCHLVETAKMNSKCAHVSFKRLRPSPFVLLSVPRPQLKCVESALAALGVPVVIHSVASEYMEVGRTG